MRVHDFEIKGLGKVAPYGVYDIAANQGWVNVGIDADTAEFAVESIRRWWQRLGRERYPKARTLTITADCGGSNGARLRLWKRELQRFADETALAITVAHRPPGTSKWNRIEHRLFAYISQNWRGKPLVSHHVIIQLIGATTTNTGLTVTCDIDQSLYPKGVKVSDAEMATLNIQRHTFQGDWNYTSLQGNKHHLDAIIPHQILYAEFPSRAPTLTRRDPRPGDRRNPRGDGELIGAPTAGTPSYAALAGSCLRL